MKRALGRMLGGAIVVACVVFGAACILGPKQDDPNGDETAGPGDAGGDGAPFDQAGGETGGDASRTDHPDAENVDATEDANDGGDAEVATDDGDVGGDTEDAGDGADGGDANAAVGD